MSRFDGEDFDEMFPNQGELWWSNVERAIKGRRGQRDLRTLERALLELPEKRLIDGALAEEGQVCAVAAFALHQRVAAGEDRDEVLAELERQFDDVGAGDVTATVGKRAGMTYVLAWRIGCLNDEDFGHMSPERRYEAVLDWVRAHIVEEAAGAA